MLEAHRHRLGLVLVAASALAWSTAGYFTRLIALDMWTMLVWRGLFGAAGILLFMVLYQPRQNLRALRRMGAPAWCFAGISAFGMVCFVASLRLTSVAHVSIVYATVPLLAAALAWLLLRERPARSALLASIAALCGVAVTVGLGSEGSVAGDLLALAMTVSLAVVMVIARRYPQAPLLPAACVSALLSALVAWPMAQQTVLGTATLFQLGQFGILNSALGLALFAIGSTMLPASETALIGALETPLAPLWVLLAFGEQPSGATVAGGALVFCAILAHLGWDSRQRARSQPEVGQCTVNTVRSSLK